MSQLLEKYLDHVMIYANRDEADAPDIRAELKDHLLKKIADLQENGLSSEQALSQSIQDHGDPKTVGYGLRPRFLWVDVRTHGTARGVLAIGPKAIGVVAIGGIACGVFAYGAIAVGLMSWGVLALGLMVALGGITLAPIGIAYGLIAIGLMAAGALSIGVWVAGGLAIGLICETSSCWYPIGQYTSETAPSIVIFIRNLALHLSGHTLILFWESVIVLLIVKLILSRKERNRIKNADPTLV